MKLAHLFAMVGLAACGGNVVLDGPSPSNGSGGSAGQGFGGLGTGGQGFGGQGFGAQANANVGTGLGGGISQVGVTSGFGGSISTGPSLSCTANDCVVGQEGACDCTGTCTDGETAEASCPGGGADCTCTLNGPNTSSGTTCTPSGQMSNPCDFVVGCCASSF